MILSPAAEIRTILRNPYKIFVGLTHHGFFSRMEDERYLRLLYRGVLGRSLHLNPPVNYSEKLQWLKLHDKNPIYTLLCDKIAVRGFVSQRVGEAYLVPLLNVWKQSDQIDFSKLPNQFVLKCSHDSGSAILCADRNTFDFEAARVTLKKKLRKDYSIAGREWPYHNVPRRILAETYLGTNDGIPPIDFKFFCFHGKVELVLVCTTDKNHKAGNYTFSPDFLPSPIYDNDENEPAIPAIQRPPHFEEMIGIAEKLAAGFIHMRVDLYDMPEGVKFGEITLHSSSGLSQTMRVSGDRCLGDLLTIETNASVVFS